MSMAEMMVQLAGDPEEAEARIAELQEEKAEAHRAMEADAAGNALRRANGRFRRAATETDPAAAQRMRFEGEEQLKGLAEVDTAVWPWFRFGQVVRDQEILVTKHGVPLYAGLRMIDADGHGYEFGRVQGVQIGRRNLGEGKWRTAKLSDLSRTEYTPEMFDAAWPDDEAQTKADIIKIVDPDDSYSGVRYEGFAALNWGWAPDDWVQRWWSNRVLMRHLVESLAKGRRTTYGYSAPTPVQEYPVKDGKKLALVDRTQISEPAELFLPDSNGWARFLQLAQKSTHPRSLLDRAAELWWARSIPRGALAPPKKK